METVLRRGAANRYIKGGHKRVAGWLDAKSGEIIASLSEFQAASGFRGSIGEIGVHHGKLFILLALTKSEGEQLFAIDVFEDQSLNTDGSGKGDRAIFLGNLRKWDMHPSDVLIRAQSSLDVDGAELLRQVGGSRLFSVDGGHTEECILNDLGIADQIMSDAGVVVIDDVFNETWPSVATGYLKYLASDPAMVPFGISPNKVFVCRPSHVENYRAYLRSKFPGYYKRSDTLSGFPVDIYGEWTQPPPFRRAIRKIKRGVKKALRLR